MALDGCSDLDDSFPMENGIVNAIRHVLDCSICQNWRKSSLEPELFELRKRVSKYCCGEMFRAIHEPKHKMIFKFDYLGPEDLPYWMAGEDSLIVNFCPWCGKVLANHAFE